MRRAHQPATGCVQSLVYNTRANKNELAHVSVRPGRRYPRPNRGQVRKQPFILSCAPEHGRATCVCAFVQYVRVGVGVGVGVCVCVCVCAPTCLHTPPILKTDRACVRPDAPERVRSRVPWRAPKVGIRRTVGPLLWRSLSSTLTLNTRPTPTRDRDRARTVRIDE